MTERLSETFAALAKAATPGPWETHTRFDEHDLAVNHAVRTHYGRQHVPNKPHDAEFIAWCGSHREAIAEALALREDPRTARGTP